MLIKHFIIIFNIDIIINKNNKYYKIFKNFVSNQMGNTKHKLFLCRANIRCRPWKCFIARLHILQA